MRKILIVVGCGAVLILGALYFLPVFLGHCYKVGNPKPVAGSQGYRIWSDETLKSFDHHNREVCVLEGWRAVGATEVGKGVARFEPTLTGILIHSDAFSSHTILPKNSSYALTVVYPVDTDAKLLEKYDAIIENAFSRVGNVFNDAPASKRTPHTVLITAGIAGDTRDESTRVYPDPNAQVTIFVRVPNHPRAEELFIHAVMHLYNRHREDLLAYQKLQAPFSADDWQELEAAWSETAFATSGQSLIRLLYLTNVYNAVRTNNFSLIAEPPFKNKKEFEKIHQSAVVRKGSPNLDYQYGHYILAPLSMLGIEGLLQKSGTGVTLEHVLTEVHRGSGKNFFEVLKNSLSQSEIDDIHDWLEGRATIPEHLIQAGFKREQGS